MKQFFAYKPEGNFRFFSLAHILVIVLGISAILLGCFFLRKMKHENVRKILIAAFITTFSMDIIYWTWELIMTGYVHVLDSLPLYYCSLFYLVLPFAIWLKSEKARNVALSYLATFNLIAGLMGLIINTNLNIYPVFSFVGIRSLLYHLIMVFVSVLIWFTKYYKPNITHCAAFFTPIAILVVPASIINSVFGTDYCYLNGGLNTPIEIVSSRLPRLIYLGLLFVAILCLVNLIFFLPTIISYRRRKRVEKVLVEVVDKN